MKKISVFLLFFCFAISFAQVPSYVPSNGLVGYWPFSGNANDISGNGNNGTVNVATLTTDRNGNVNSAYSFLNGSQFITLPSPPVNTFTNTMSYSLWYKEIPNTNYVNIFNTTNNKALVLNPNATGIRANDGNSFGLDANSSALNVNGWKHICVVYVGQVISIYINGVLANSGTTGFPNTILYNSTQSIVGATYLMGGQYPFSGLIDDIGIWNRALNGQEIANLYNSCLTPAPTGNVSQLFCATPTPTVASLIATGTAIQWYAAATGGSPLASSTALVDGTTYYASQTVNGCESSIRLAVTIEMFNPTISTTNSTICSGNNVSLTANSGITTSSRFNVGSIGPSGGYVFYDQGSVINGWRYLEAAPVDNGSNNGIGCYCTAIPNTSTSIGAGLSNTSSWINSGCNTNGSWVNTSTIYQANGNSGWFIPSKDEVNLMYTNLKLNNLGNFLNVQYWSSSPAPYGSCGVNGGAWVQNFQTGNFVSEYRSGFGGAGNLRLVRRFVTGMPFTTYLWSTGATTATINPSPTATTTYWCDVTVNGVTCRKEVTIAVNSIPAAPTGTATQTFCATPAPTITNLMATGTGIQWYAAASGGSPLASTTVLGDGTTYYASQTVNGCESNTRLAINISLNNPTVTVSNTTICPGQTTTLTISDGNSQQPINNKIAEFTNNISN
ncbi:LamG-like jellyroll fold domain-containing protein, partial [Flavobacterium sp.]|uniref:LamG-like jellyroll fold domain-containing protein n=1 Tax=Flavobacterium sp. TaxID=239 RepID=UPI0037C0893C